MTQIYTDRKIKLLTMKVMKDMKIKQTATAGNRILGFPAIAEKSVCICVHLWLNGFSTTKVTKGTKKTILATD